MIDGKTGVLFHEQTTDSLIGAVSRFEAMVKKFSISEIRQNAERFDEGIFRREFKRFMDNAIAKHQESKIQDIVKTIPLKEAALARTRQKEAI